MVHSSSNDAKCDAVFEHALPPAVGMYGCGLHVRPVPQSLSLLHAAVLTLTAQLNVVYA